jgi:DDE superfamily endonuclease
MVGIVRRSALVVSFVGLLSLSLKQPQLRHLERLADVLVVAPRKKTLAQLAALELDGVDASNLADFFRISPWEADDVRLALLRFIIADLAQRVPDPSLPIYLTVDDSLTVKDKGTQRLQSVDWHFDHNRHQVVKGGNHVVVGIHWGKYHYPLVWRLYLRQSTVRRINRRRNNQRLRYRSKLELARALLQEIIAYLPADQAVYVLFDSWYTSAKLVRWIGEQGWHVIAGLKSNRKVSGRKMTDWHKELKGQRYRQVRLHLANGRQRTYWVRSVTGRLRGVRGEVRVLLSQTGPGAKAPKYFLCTDPSLSLQEILSRYQYRWSQEVDYWHVKLQLGLGDFRMQIYEAIEKWYAVVYLVFTMLYWRCYEDRDQHQRTTSLSEVLSQMREEHQGAVLRSACEEVAAGASVDEVVQRYLRQPKTQAA